MRHYKIMRSINSRFKQRQKNNPGWSTWTCFADAIIDQNFKKETIQENFNMLVDKNDYASNEKMQLLKYLYEITKPSMRSRSKWYKIRF